MSTINSTPNAEATSASKEAAAKERIIKHMNADHADSISYYAQHYCSLSSSAAQGAILSDIFLSSMTVRTKDGKTHSIGINPPMKSWSEARVRTVDMDREARSALDVSSIRITSYQPPRKPFHIFVFGACLFAFSVFILKDRIVPGTWFYDVVLPYFPGGPERFIWLAKSLALPTLAIHLVEAFMLDRTRLRKYGVQRWTGLWFAWITSCFIEGFGCFARIDAAVARKKKEAEKSQH